MWNFKGTFEIPYKISYHILNHHHLIDGLVQDCSISIANALEILQSCIKPSLSIFRLGCCPYPIQWSWQHQATPNTGSLSTSVLWVTNTDISLDTFRPCLFRPSFPSGAGKRKVCDRFYTGRGTLYMSITSQLPAAKDCCNILNAKFLE